MCGFIAQLVEQRTGNAEVTGSNPVEALIFFRLLLSNCLNWKITQPNMIYTISCLCSCWCAFNSFEILPQIRFQTPSLIRSLYFSD